MKNALLALLALAAVVEGALLVRQSRELAALRATTEQQVEALATLEKAKASRPAPAKAVAATPKSERVAAPIRVEAPTPAQLAEAQPATDAKKPDMGKFMAGLGNMMTNPAMKEMIRTQTRMQLDMRYDRLIKFFELSPEDAEKFKNLLMDRQMAMMDAGLSFMNKDQSPEEREAKTKQMAASKKVFDDQLKELLGAEDFESLTQFEATEPERMQVDMFKHSLAGKSDALSEQQEYDLVNAMYKARSSSSSSMVRGSPDTMPDADAFTAEGMKKTMEEMKKVQAAYDASAQAILSPAQFAEFKKFADQQRAMQEMGMQMAAQMFGGDKK